MKVAIVGAGVVGRLTALQLLADNSRDNILKNNYHVTNKVSIFDRHCLTQPSNLTQPSSAAHVSAGMLCPLGEATHATTEIVDMGLWSLQHWPALLQTLKQLDPKGEDVFYQANGSLALAFPEDENCYRQFQQDVSFSTKKHQDAIKYLDKTQLTELEPSLSRFNKAIWLTTEAQLCNRQFLSASTRVLQTLATVNTGKQLSQQDIEKLGEQYDWVIDCRGSGAIGHSGGQLPDDALRGIRGEALRVYCPDVLLNRPVRVIHPRNSIYIVPKPNHEFVIGATEIETQADHPITLRSCLELMTTLYAIHPGFAEAQVLETNVGIRAAYANNTPKVQQVGNLVSANGLYRHGWLVGPAVVDQILKIMHKDKGASDGKSEHERENESESESESELHH